MLVHRRKRRPYGTGRTTEGERGLIRSFATCTNNFPKREA